MTYLKELRDRYAAINLRLYGPMRKQFVPAPAAPIDLIANANPGRHESQPMSAREEATRESRRDCGFDPGSQGSVAPPLLTQKEMIAASIALARKIADREPVSKRAFICRRAVAKVFHVREADITGPRRFAHLVMVRQIGMTIARELFDCSWLEIGRAFGGRDHTTALHAHSKYCHIVAPLVEEAQ